MKIINDHTLIYRHANVITKKTIKVENKLPQVSPPSSSPNQTGSGPVSLAESMQVTYIVVVVVNITNIAIINDNLSSTS